MLDDDGMCSAKVSSTLPACIGQTSVASEWCAAAVVAHLAVDAVDEDGRCALMHAAAWGDVPGERRKGPVPPQARVGAAPILSPRKPEQKVVEDRALAAGGKNAPGGVESPEVPHGKEGDLGEEGAELRGVNRGSKGAASFESEMNVAPWAWAPQPPSAPPCWW